MLFEFRLRVIDEVDPWGSEGAYSLSWFGLTDGWYWLKCGNDELFRYSNVIVESWKSENPQSCALPYVDYYVVRLWEDILQILPAVLTPVPTELLRRIEPSFEADLWQNQIFESLFDDKDEVSSQTEERFNLAINWLHDRKLDSGYLQQSPRIWLWTDGVTMFIHWDNRGLEFDGRDAWTSPRGTFRLPLAVFIDEIRSFDRRLIEAMEQRVQTIQHTWNRPYIKIDKEGLLIEQSERALALSETFQRAKSHPVPNWNEIMEAITHFEKLGHTLPEQHCSD